MTHAIEAVPQQAPPTLDAHAVQSGLSRRDFLRLSGLTAGAGLLAACAPPSPGTLAAAGAAADVARTHGPSVVSAIQNHIEQAQQQPDAGTETEFTQNGPTIADLFSGEAEIPEKPIEAVKTGANAALESLRLYNQEYALGADIPDKAELVSTEDFTALFQEENSEPGHTEHAPLLSHARPILAIRLNGMPDSTRLLIDKDSPVIDTADPDHLAFWAIQATLAAALRVQPPYETQETPYPVKPQREAGTMQADWVWGWSMGGNENESQKAWQIQGFANGCNELAAMSLIMEEARRAKMSDEHIAQLFTRFSRTSEFTHVAQFVIACRADPIDLWKAGSYTDISQSMQYLATQHEKTFPAYANREQAMMLYVLAPEMLDPTSRDLVMPVLLPTDAEQPAPVSDEPKQTVTVFHGLEPKIDPGVIDMKIESALPRRPIS